MSTGSTGNRRRPVSDEIRRLIIGDDEVITVRPADLLEPAYEKMKEGGRESRAREKGRGCPDLYPLPGNCPFVPERRADAGRDPEKAAVAKPASEMPSQMEVEVDGEVFSVRIISVGGSNVEVAGVTPQKESRGEIAGGIKSNMQGMVLKVLVSRGAAVKKGDTLLVLEAMKMENPIHSPVDGKVTEIFVDTGDVVQNGDVLLVVQ